MKGCGNADWITGPSCAMTPHKIATVERRKACVPQGTRHPSQGCHLRLGADRRSASLTHVRDTEKGRRAPRAGWEGADESRLHRCGPLRQAKPAVHPISCGLCAAMVQALVQA